MEEIWKDIEGFEGKYQISNLGRILMLGLYSDGRSYKRRIKKTRFNKDGYEYANLTDWNGNVKTFKIHRLVATHFIPNPNNYPCVDHIDTVKANNKLDNLRWCTYVMNANNPITKQHLSNSCRLYSLQDFVREQRRINALKKENIEARRIKVIKAVEQFNKNGEYVQTFNSVTEAAKSVQGKTTNITRACKGRRHIAYGFIWKYKNEHE